MSSRYFPFALVGFACLACSKDPEPADNSHAADFTYTAGLSAGEPITFSSASSDAQRYQWDFGDGTAPVAGQRATHTFAKTGLFSVKLIASTAGGDVTNTRQLSITQTVADFTYTGTLKIGVPLAFSGTSPNAQTYQWDFGDGTAAGSGRYVAHAFLKAGTFPVKLTASTTVGPVVSTQQLIITQNDSLNPYFAAVAGDYRLTKQYSYASGSSPNTTPCDILVTASRDGDFLVIKQNGSGLTYPLRLQPSSYIPGYYTFRYSDFRTQDQASFRIGGDSIVIRDFYGGTGGSLERKWWGKRR